MPRSGRRSAVIDFLLISGVAAFLIWPLFWVEYFQNWGSIDATFIADARFLVENWPHPTWQPNWYTGTRFDYIYPPGIRYGTAVLSMLFDVSTARAYHLFTAILYVIGIGAVYVLVRVGTGSRVWGWIAALLTTTVSPSFLFLPIFRHGYAALRYMPVRLGVLVDWGEGPHASAFALLPLALAAAWLGLRRGHTMALAFAALISTCLVLTNFYGATALAIFFPIVAWTVWLAEGDHFVWLRAAGIAAFSYALAAFWLTPSYLRITLRNMQLVSNPGNVWSIWLGIAAAAVFAFVSWKVAWRKPERAWAVFCSGGLALMALDVLGNSFFDFRIIGEPLRLIPEFDMIFLIAACAVLARLWRGSFVAKAAIIVLLVGAVYPSSGWLRRSWQFFAADLNPTQRVEYRISEWVHRNLPGVRMAATGSMRFWFNAWFTQPQMGGGSEQGIINLIAYEGSSQIPGDNPIKVSIRWAQTLGIGAVIVHDATSQEIYHDYNKPERFQIFKKLYEDGKGNWIYEVPRRYPDRARVVDAAAIRKLGLASRVMDWGMHERYLSLIEEGPAAPVSMQFLATDKISARAHLEPGQAILVQESFDPAWRAYSGGKPVPIQEEFMGFMLLDPGPGEHDILLQFETPLENRIGRVVTMLAIVFFGGCVWRGRRRRPV